MNIETQLNETFKRLIQHKIAIRCGNRIIRSGKLMNFYEREHYIILNIVSERRKHAYVLFFPYGITTEGDKTILDYRIESLTLGNEMTHTRAIILQSTSTKHHVMHNKLVEIEIL